MNSDSPRPCFSRIWLATLFAGFVWLEATTVALGAPPTLTNLNVRGLQTGGTTTLVVTGADLLPDPRVVLPFAVAQQVVKEGAAANQVQIDITLDAAVSPGIYQLRLVTSQGISAPLTVGVDHLPELPFAPEIASLPVALNGAYQGAAVLRTSFNGVKDQPLVVEIEGRRLGGELNPVLHLYDSRNVQLAWAQGSPSIFGDARIVARLPADGRYTIELHDALYRGAAPGAFRLKVGQLHFADMVFPLGVRLGGAANLEFVSSNIPSASTVPAAQLDVAGEAPAAWPALEWLSGAAPRVSYTEQDELVEVAAADGQLQSLSLPSAVSGRLAAPGEEDSYQIPVTAGQALRFDVLAGRLGSPLDGILSIRNAAGAELANNDDRPATTDPGLDFTVPAGVDALVLSVKDLQRGGGPDYVYRLSVSQVGLPDYSLTVFNERIQPPSGGAAVVRVRANRMGYNGAIKLTLAGLPAGVTMTGDEIPAGATDTLLSLTAGDQVIAPLLTRIVGDSLEPNAMLRRVAQLVETPTSKYQPWLRGELALAGAAPGPLNVNWDVASGDPLLPLGASLPLRVNVTRAAGAAGAVRLTLLTSQIMPQKTIKENNQDKQVDDLDRALRLDGAPVIPADQAELTAQLLVPGDLAALPYDLAVQADLLAADNTTVLASAVAPAKRLTITQPFTVELAGEAKVEAKAGAGDSGKLIGRVKRVGGFSQPLTITLQGLPAELPAPEVTISGQDVEFALPVAFPFGSALGDVPNVQLVAVHKVSPTVSITSNASPVAVSVVAGGPPPALYRLFEDESYVVNLLNEGGGQISLETNDRYTGAASLKVTPDQRFRAKLPGLGVKIAENPGDGEFRYLRYAWKKRGGGNVLLQLNANGAFGPQAGQPGAAFRYESGPAENPFKAAAVKVDAVLPENWVVVTRDLFADFGAFSFDGLALTASDGEYALFDHFYLARTQDDLNGCPMPAPAEQPLAVFEDQAEFVTHLSQGGGVASLFADDKYSGAASVKVTPDQRFNPALPGLGLKIRQNPGPGEYRYFQFAWKKQGGERICLQLNHDGQWGPTAQSPGKFRYDAGPGQGESYGAALRVDNALPAGFVVVTRDLFTDFGEFTLTGLALSPQDGEFALFDHIYLGRSPQDFDLVKP